MTHSRSLSDIDHSTAANDPRPSASCSARKNPQRIPANTPPVFPGLWPRIWPHLLRLVTNGNVGQAPRVVIFLPLAITIFTPAIAVLRAEDAVRIQMQLTQMGQAPRQGQVLEGSQMVRPSPKERDAVNQMLTTKPRPKTLKDADIKYLKDLLNKATWVGFERRIVHEMWTEVSGKEWHDTEVSQPPKNEKSP